MLCSRDPGTEIELQRVRYTAPVEPLAIMVMVRTYSPGLVAQLPPRARQSFAPFINTLGEPPRFQETNMAVPQGTFSDRIAGVRVNVPCGDATRIGNALSHGKAPGRALQELLFVLTVGPAGGEISNAYIDYVADGRPATLHLRWIMVACGSRITDKSICTKG